MYDFEEIKKSKCGSKVCNESLENIIRNLKKDIMFKIMDVVKYVLEKFYRCLKIIFFDFVG